MYCPILKSTNNKGSLIFLHGFGSDANSSAQWFNEMGFSEIYDCFFPQAPRSTELGGYEWHDLYLLHDQDYKSSVETSRLQLENWISSVVIRRPVYLCGFSQGGLMALHWFLNNDEHFDKVALLSSYTLTMPYIKKDRHQKILVSYGDRDHVIPGSLTLSVTHLLRETGCQNISTQSFKGAHTIEQTLLMNFLLGDEGNHDQYT